MDEIHVEPTSDELESGKRPSHKVILTHGSEQFVFWYIKGKPDARNFDKMKDTRVVEAAHNTGLQLRVKGNGAFTVKGHDIEKYIVRRESSHEFELETDD